eukprot:CAMPEP_0171697212 /NCGR_PEP_ID=MMETSP0991-20121206/8697_1 /TAXON_ID=483369 /ORGANISM="non described non described, Strain CCMP2098" /LENGTH=438 /DNA_ID=CAMNT_0012285983 /DNA_START=222 /DNA_END=1538 /DNA_ORIENTATION=-
MRDGIDLGSWPYSRLASVESEPFDGVRNFQARNYLRDHVRAGDMVFYYHSSCKKPGIYGISEICGPSYPDPTALEEKHPLFDPKHTTADPRWYTVDLKAVRALNPPVLLHTLKATPELSDMVLRRQPRLSVQPVTEKEWDTVLALADMTAKKTVTLNLDGVSESNGNDLKTSEQPASPALSPFSSLTVAELKDLLRAASLSQQGKKAELVSRLLAHGSSGGDGPSTTATPTQIQRQEERTMVFCNTAASAAKVCDALNERGVASLPYHKEVSAEEREANLNAFAAASNSLASLAGTTDIELGDDSGALTSVPRVLVCTDLAARGLDVQGPSALVDPQGQGNKMGVDHVVQFEFALNVVQHLHRLGRTARAGQPGKATHLVQPAGSAGAALADHVRRATEEGLPLEESFSRKRGFRKKIKKTGQPFNSKASQQRGSGRG